MRCFPCALLLTSSGLAAAQGPARVVEGSESGSVAIPETLRFDMRSRDGLVYRIFIARPTGQQPKHGWPVVYHTDGNTGFPVLIAAVERQSRHERPAVVVGIGYPDNTTAVRCGRRTF